MITRKEYKDAFANGGRAVRMLVIYQLGLNQEATNKELLNHLDHKMPNFMKISGALGKPTAPGQFSAKQLSR